MTKMHDSSFNQVAFKQKLDVLATHTENEKAGNGSSILDQILICIYLKTSNPILVTAIHGKIMKFTVEIHYMLLNIFR